MARYLLENPDRDPEWREHARHLLDWIERTFGGTHREGDRACSGGRSRSPSRSNTCTRWAATPSRFASVQALLVREDRRRGRPREGVPLVQLGELHVRRARRRARGPDRDRRFWFSDGYGDYIRHFMAGLGAVPEWAPAGRGPPPSLHRRSCPRSPTRRGRVRYRHVRRRRGGSAPGDLRAADGDRGRHALSGPPATARASPSRRRRESSGFGGRRPDR